MSRSRILPSIAETKPKQIGPQNVREWNNLLTRAIQRAEATQDRRLEGLRRAMVEGRSEKILRQMSILSDTDLDREFPQKT